MAAGAAEDCGITITLEVGRSKLACVNRVCDTSAGPSGTQVACQTLAGTIGLDSPAASFGSVGPGSFGAVRTGPVAEAGFAGLSRAGAGTAWSEDFANSLSCQSTVSKSGPLSAGVPGDCPATVLFPGTSKGTVASPTTKGGGLADA